MLIFIFNMEDLSFLFHLNYVYFINQCSLPNLIIVDLNLYTVYRSRSLITKKPHRYFLRINKFKAKTQRKTKQTIYISVQAMWKSVMAILFKREVYKDFFWFIKQVSFRFHTRFIFIIWWSYISFLSSAFNFFSPCNYILS